MRRRQSVTVIVKELDDGLVEDFQRTQEGE